MRALLRVLACFAIGWGATSAFFSALMWHLLYVQTLPPAIAARIAPDTAESVKLIVQGSLAVATFLGGIVMLRQGRSGLRLLRWIAIAAILWSVAVRAASSAAMTWRESALWLGAVTSLAGATLSSVFSTYGLIAGLSFPIERMLDRPPSSQTTQP